MLIPEDSPLRKPPAEFSRRQVLLLDGLRYSAEMAHIAYERLYANAQAMAASKDEPSVREIATCMLDAWSIIDSANRFRDLLENLPGLPNSPWRRLLRDRTEDAAALRDCVQHQLGETDRLCVQGGQLWGYLSWAEVRDGLYTGKWLMAAAGSDFIGDQWLFVGPNTLPFAVPMGRIRLNAFGRRIYIGRMVQALAEAAHKLATEINNGTMRPRGDPAVERRGADIVYEARLEVAILREQVRSESGQGS